jgi:hypothetical protein
MRSRLTPSCHRNCDEVLVGSHTAVSVALFIGGTGLTVLRVDAGRGLREAVSTPRQARAVLRRRTAGVDLGTIAV